MNREIVFALYRPHPAKEKALEKLVRDHVPTLLRLGLVTDRAALHARAKNGTVIEVFEWTSRDAARRAHEHPEVARVWEAMGEVSNFVSLDTLEEATGTFPHFQPMGE